MSKKIINSSEAPAAVGPYSHAVLANGFLFVSGQVPLLADGNLLEGTIEEETHQVMKNLKAILQEASLDFQDVVKCSIFVKDMDNFQKINAVYGSYFEENPPARETVEVGHLPLNVNVEISCIALAKS